MMKNFFKISQYALFLSFAFFMVWWSLKGVDVRYLIQIMLKAKISIVIITILILICSHFIRALRWKLLIQPLGYNPSTLNAFFCVLIGYFANLLIPRFGEVLRCTLLAKYEKKPVDAIIGTVLLERVIDFVCLILVCLLVFVLQIDLISTFFREQLLPVLKTMHPLSYLLFLVGLIAFLFIAIYFSRKNKKFDILFLKVKTFLMGIVSGMRTILQLQNKGAFLAYTFLIWASYLSGFWIGFKALEQTDLLGIIPSLTCLVTGSIGMIATQGGIGAYPHLVAQTLTWYGIEEIYGVSMGWLNWFIQFLIIIVTGSISWILLPLYNRNRS